MCDCTTLYYTLLELHLAVRVSTALYHGSTLFYYTLLHYYILWLYLALLDSTTLYYIVCTMAILGFTTLYYDAATRHYVTHLHSTMALPDSS